MMPQAVTLTWYEMLAACHAGLSWQFDIIRRGSKTRCINEKHTFMQNCGIAMDAAGAEIAVAKLFNKYWRTGPDDLDDPDVGHATEVRHTTRPDGRMTISPDTHEERRYFLVRGTMPNYIVVGWAWGRDCTRDEWRENYYGNDVFMVPAETLHTDFEQKQQGAA